MKKFKFLGLLSVFSLFISFGYCVMDIPTNDFGGNGLISVDGFDGYNYGYESYYFGNDGTQVHLSSSYDMYCFNHSMGGSAQWSIDGIDWYNMPQYSLFCYNGENDVIFIRGQVVFYYFKFGDYGIPAKYTSQQCQSEYGLISPNDVQMEIKFNESEYTSTSYYLGYNKLATINLNGNPYTVSQINGDYTFNIQENQGGQCTGSVITGDNWSALYVNDLQFPGKSSIFVNIPDYITWDYKSTENDFTIDIGSGYDVDYINSIVDINSYRPDSTDFTNIFVSGLTLIFPYIVFALFILFMWKLLKRIFK